jgi:hypothetical protein
MTEAEWLACEDPCLMLEFLGDKASDRKSRLFACACCRRVLQAISNDFVEASVVAAERHADGSLLDDEIAAVNADVNERLADDEPLRRCCDSATQVNGIAGRIAFRSSVCAADALAIASNEEFALGVHTRWTPSWTEALVEQSRLVREIFGSPFRPGAFSPYWSTPTVLALAQTAYNDRAFDRLPILADALEDAGCTDRAILDHLRGPGPHVRGCWALDLILGKQ